MYLLTAIGLTPGGSSTVHIYTQIHRTALYWNPQGQWRRGRPKQTWRRLVHSETLGEGKSWGKIKQLARNRIRSDKIIISWIRYDLETSSCILLKVLCKKNLQWMTKTMQILVQTIFQPWDTITWLATCKKGALHYTTEFSGKNSWRQTSKEMDKWIIEATMEDKTDSDTGMVQLCWVSVTCHSGSTSGCLYNCMWCVLPFTVAPLVDACTTACDVCYLSQWLH
jgi:hypothetical protein